MKLATSHLEDYVQEMYESINIIKPEQLNMETIASGLGVSLILEETNSRCMDTYGDCFIFIDSRLSEQQQFEEFCHELCHAMWHMGTQRNMPLPYMLYQEWKAEGFMLQAAVPSFMLEPVISKADYKHEAVALISKTFGITEDTAFKRLNQHLSKVQEHELNEQFQFKMKRIYRYL
ncbi:ImmA/IrrE family metallo-endopeptidase [Jeotgalibacillus malaysiensis]|uniref:ImmA/IrrE family metallo-endopeptidase n=1 Tax=Jeotgalibacillus malaysiensis TaxID=1508404 RepID=UPI00384A6243